MIEVMQVGAAMLGAPETARTHKVHLLVDLTNTTATDLVAQLSALEDDPGDWRMAPADLKHSNPNVVVLTFVKQRSAWTPPAVPA